MRDVTLKVMTAFKEGRRAKVKSTHTDGNNVWLHGNLIAWRGTNGLVHFTLAGWNTVTTRERVNGLLRVMGVRASVFQKNHAPYMWLQDEETTFPISSREVMVAGHGKLLFRHC